MRRHLLLMVSCGLFFLTGMTVCQSKAVSGEDKLSVVQTAKKDLAERLNLTERTIEFVGSIEEVTWPDSSLGCPEPGKVYSQALIPGFKFQLRGGGKIYQVHAGNGAVKFCPT